MTSPKKKIFITGTAGFIGFHLSKKLLQAGFSVCGYDGMTDYYDVALKQKRHEILVRNFPQFSVVEGLLEDEEKLNKTVSDYKADIIVHLAAQAGVRYSLENPRAYLNTNVIGTFNVMEAARNIKVEHLMMASTSSVYGANQKMPFHEMQNTDSQLTIYAATKKANENMGHVYSHLYNVPITMFRFFTVYGPWGRPDLALFKFVERILDGRPIDIYNHGKMYRDFTYVDDLVKSIELLMSIPPSAHTNESYLTPRYDHDQSVPFRVVNIGNSQRIRLLDFIDAIEECVGQKAERNYMEMQTGDVPSTWADTERLQNLINYIPTTNYKDGISEFVNWYRDYYGK